MSLSPLIEPGFFSSAEVQTALAIGALAAVVSAIVGVFTVLRGQSFAGHALTDASATGGSGLVLAGASPLLGFVLGAAGGGAAMEAIGVHNARGRDLATGIVLGAAIGLAALFLFLDTSSTTTGATQQILFGEIFAVAPGEVAVVAGLGAAACGIVALLFRPLTLSSVSPELAAARGIPVRLVGVAAMLALALAVSLSALVVGAILSTALLIGPPATALRLTRRIASALLVAAVLGVGSCWLGVLLSYDSATWFSNGNGLPVSFFIVAVVFFAYLVVHFVVPGAGRRWARART